MKKRSFVLAGALGLTAVAALSGCGKKSDAETSNGSVYVYNWGDYIDESLIEQFEEETGIDVIYDTYTTNELMYPVISQGAVTYDVVCPSDYMIQKMMENDLLQEINYDNIPNISNISSTILEKMATFDPGNKYSVPYCWGTVGILYNTTMVDEEVTSWDVLWDEKYSNNILMLDSVRDSFLVALQSLGYSSNSTDDAQLQEARDFLIAQKPLVQAYVVDQAKDMMIGGEAALAVVYSGDYLVTVEQNPDLAYFIPEEGSNVWFDGWVIPKNAENKENAEAWINFLCRADVALKNFEYIGYATPNTAAMEDIDEAYLNDPGVFAPDDVVEKCEVFQYLGEEIESTYNNYWTEVLSH